MINVKFGAVGTGAGAEPEPHLITAPFHQNNAVPCGSGSTALVTSATTAIENRQIVLEVMSIFSYLILGGRDLFSAAVDYPAGAPL
jgi:hypothetical protein